MGVGYPEGGKVLVIGGRVLRGEAGYPRGSRVIQRRVGYTHPPQMGYGTRHTLPLPRRNVGPEIPPEGTWDQRYLTSREEHGTRDQEGTWHQRYPTPTPSEKIGRHLCKHYLPATSLASGNNMTFP